MSIVFLQRSRSLSCLQLCPETGNQLRFDSQPVTTNREHGVLMSVNGRVDFYNEVACFRMV
ncbi:MAG: hypothetical protein ISR54_00140 [Chlorobium phaeobacteroides]|nr:hypothetical protein [Chlorobium phaeobacteroides]MBL6955227.1 hypothetical protein [Chlorobium phaeobacteroides]